MRVHGYAALKKGGAMTPVQFDREPLADGEVAIDITHCGVCHSDLHQVNDDWKNSLYPCLPGHEIVGTVREVGKGVGKVKAGDRVGVGCMVNSCQQCDYCKAGEEQYCSGPKSCTLTYNGPKVPDGTNSYGGYSSGIIVREEFVMTIPDAINSAEAAPILCAGVTTYQPMKHFGVKKGDTVGVAGIGGLGHMAIQTAKAMGATVIALSTSPDKAGEAQKLGASKLIDMNDKKAVEEAAQSLDFLISTIPYSHDLNPYIGMMKTDSTIAVVGKFDRFPEDRDGAAGDEPDPHRRLADRRDRGHAGNPRLRRRARHPSRGRAHRDEGHRRCLRPDEEGRCALPPRHRHGDAEVRRGREGNRPAGARRGRRLG